jgi:uncharacterized protein
MRRIAIVVAVVAAAVGCDRARESQSHTQSDPPPDRVANVAPAPVPPVPPLPHPLFWAITKDGTTTYAFGTMHAGVDAEQRLPKLVWEKLALEPAFAMETDLHDPVLATIGQRTSGTLHEDLGSEYWKKLEDKLGSQVAKQIDHMKPMIPASILALKGLPATPPMDGALLERATATGKRVVYLEQAADEIAVLDRVLDLRMLKLMLDEPDLEKDSRDMLDAYVSGDEAKIVAVNDNQKIEALAHGFSPAEYEQQMEDLLYHRNSAWIPVIEKLHANGGGFIAVGALHLVGPKSVLALLAAKGYRIQRVKL